MPTGSAHPCLAMAALTSFGGIYGFMKKGSKASAMAGLFFGGVYAAAGYMIGENMEEGHDLAVVNSTVLALFMGPRAWKTGKMMPGGVVAGCALLAGSYNAYKSYSFRV
mmetsp:Transcript_9410/g.14190  ORF Transcript_9410/g.14190 Transcript_9410/m.14190 type:complete len:109 (-) Transcript_9410:120-446(-)|eukprot:CAMPEP_0185024756 /NCGR_PEP_ID=MMETSP1103-20130426/7968_1 /TAXON_ID=36769 /ORGANISM="Paraphysomonas bandaiensis, Strain Caron Lab Isolate" /LENGTH=108 /DNA_ID=CAMNT_0027557817 /DNA_START=58 /DNA_END=384 /DNA_ORIENTATION=+